MWIRTRSGPLVNVITGSVIRHTPHEGGYRVYLKFGPDETDITFLPNDPVVLKRVADVYNEIWKHLEKGAAILDFSIVGQQTPKKPTRP